jgi:hypothetical protein
MTELRHQVSDEWVARYDRAIRVGYYASQTCVIVALGACLAGYIVHVPSEWIARTLGSGIALFILWVQAAKYQTARIRLATAEIAEYTQRVHREAQDIEHETRRIRRETAEIEAGTARSRGEVQ